LHFLKCYKKPVYQYITI